MTPLALSRKALTDLRAIAVYTEKRWGRAQRNRYLEQLDRAFHLLAANPLAGQECDYISLGYRKFPEGSHVIYYRKGNGCVIEIIRILHSAMDVDAADL